MSEPLRRMLGPLGAEVLHILWRSEAPLSVRQVQEQLNQARDKPLAYTTVMTVLARLTTRKILQRTPRGRGYVYEPAVVDVADTAVKNLIRDHGDAAVAHFVDQVEAEPHLRQRLQKLMEANRLPADADWRVPEEPEWN